MYKFVQAAGNKLTFFRQSAIRLSGTALNQSALHTASNSAKLFALLRKYPDGEVGFTSVLEVTFLQDPSIHPQIQHAARPLHELRQVATIYGARNVKRLIYYVLPHREILYRTIAFAVAHVRTESSEQLYQIVAKCYKTYTGKSLRGINDTYKQILQRSVWQAREILLTYEETQQTSDEVLDMLVEPYLVEQHATGDANSVKLSENPSLLMAYADSLTKKSLAAEISQGMQEDNQLLFSQGLIEPIPAVFASERVTYIVAGASATGKGELTKRLIEQKELELGKICRIIPDEWHYLLKYVGDSTNLGLDTKHHGVLLREETLIIREIIMASFIDLIRNNQPVPHCFMEVIIPTSERMAFATMGGGSVKCYLTSHNNPIKVVEGSIARYEKTGRLVWPAVILKSLQDVSQESPNTIKWILGSRDKAQIEVHDMTYLHEGISPPTKPIYTADSSSGKMIIYDLENMLRSFSNRYLNRHAKDAEGLYLKLIKGNNLKEIVADFKTAYKDIIGSIVLVDPTANFFDSQSIDEHLYAHFNDAGQLIIDNQFI